MTIPEQAHSHVKLLAERIESLKTCRVHLEKLKVCRVHLEKRRTAQLCDIELELKQLIAEQEKWKSRL